MKLAFNWENTLLTAILSTIVSLGANKFVIERGQKMRLHSEKLVELAFKKWTQSIEHVSNRGSEYDENRCAYVPFSSKTLDIPHADFLLSHVKSGYNEVYENWNDILICAYEYSNCEAQLKNLILSQIAEYSTNKKIEFYFYKLGRDMPHQHIRPKLVVKEIMTELKYRHENEGKWIQKNESILQGDSKGDYYRVKIGDSEVAHILDSKDADYILESCQKIPEIKTISKKYDDLMVLEARFLRIKSKLFIGINNIISEIELGLNLEGNCTACPGYF